MIKIGDIVRKYEYGVPTSLLRVIGFKRIGHYHHDRTICIFENHKGYQNSEHIRNLTVYQPEKLSHIN